MNLKKVSASVFVAIMLSMSTVSLISAQENQINESVEGNEASTYGYTAPSDSKLINLNQNNTFKVDKENNKEWSKFIIDERGYITLNLDKALFAGNKEGDVDIIIQDEAGKVEYLKTDSCCTKLKTDTVNQWKIGLKPGTYYMRLMANFSTGESYMNLNYKVGFTKNDNFEMERYDTNINLNTNYSGIIDENGGYSYYTTYNDNYKFTVKENGHYAFNINHGLNENYNFVVKDRYDRSIASFYSSSMSSSDGRNYSYTLKDLTPGEYRLTISDSGNPQDEYTFSISKSKHGWVKEGNYWYYYNEGIMQIDWQTIDGKEYFFDSYGKMKTGWFNDYGTWYYLGNSGAKQKGWLNEKGTWYYLDDESGVMQTGLQDIGSNKYYFADNGIMFDKGWKNIDGYYYYFNQGGSAKKGWYKENNKWYYLNDYTGEMETGITYIGGKTYYFASSGVMFNNGWKKINGQYYYFNLNGDAKTGWYKEKGTWYYLYSDGEMATGKTTIGGASYIFNENGRMRTGWIEYGYDWYYANSNGALKRGWFKDKGNWYFFHSTYNYMLTGGWWIDYEYNYFDENGVWKY